jgi:hypothetical protein
MMFEGGVVLLFDGLLILFLLKEIHGTGVFCSRPNPYRGEAVNQSRSSLKSWAHIICTHSG